MNLHQFWFGDIELSENYYSTQIKRWFFGQCGKFDQDCGSYIDSVADTPIERILKLDQLPRNVFRGSKKAFERDLEAQALSLSLLDTEYERSLSLPERIFLYMPLEHAEDLKLQELSVEKFYELHRLAPKEIRAWTQLGLSKAIDHQKTIREHGYFPSRVNY